MFRFCGRIFRWAAVGTLALVGLTALVGVNRVKTAFWSVRDNLRGSVDELVDSRIALRHELKKLQHDYPKRISELRVQLHEIDRDLVACERDRNVSQEVVTLCENDVALLRERIAAGSDGGSFVSVEFRSELLDQNEAVARASRIAETASAYRARVADLRQEDEMLRTERGRLKAELANLEQEYRAFQAEVGTLLREIDAVKRKEKLVALAERKRKENDDLFEDRASALERVKEKISRHRIELDERLRAARSFPAVDDYEARARLSLSRSE
jgi:chromosome segregation ATPase